MIRTQEISLVLAQKMLIFSLQSGSNGNCIYVETSHARLLLDAGISGVSAEKRLAEIGRDIRDVDAVIISHDHSDHVRCAGVFHRKYQLPVYMSRGTYRAASGHQPLGPMEVNEFKAGETLHFGDIAIETVRTPHDAAEGVAFVIAAPEGRVGVLTDLGNPFKGLGETICSLDAVLMESNYDPDMLANGPYPAFLKARIRGPGGHLSNHESAKLLTECGGRLKWICLAHLSEQNNHPDLAVAAHAKMANGRTLCAASRYKATGPFEI